MTFDLEYALEQYGRLKSDFSRWRVVATNYLEKYQQEHWESAMQEGDYQATLPIEALVVDTAHAIITSNKPLLTIVPQGDSSREDAQADRTERWHMGVDYLNALNEGAIVHERGLFDALVTGLGWLREVADFPVDWETKAEVDPEEYRYRPFFVQQTLHSSSVFFLRGRYPGGIRKLCYEANYSVAEIESEWGVSARLLTDEKGRFLPKDYNEQRTVVDYWEWITEAKKPALYHCVFVSSPEQWLKRPVIMEEYLRIPYYPIPCYETTEDEPEKRYLSFIFKLREMPHLVEILLSRGLVIIEKYADPMVIAKSASGTPIPMEKGPGSIIDMGPEDDVHYLEVRGAPPDMERVRQFLTDFISMAGFSPAIFSQGTGDTGLARVTDIEQAFFKIARPTLNLKRALEEIYWHRAHLAKVFSPNKAIPVFGEDVRGKPFSLSLTGKQIAKNAQVNVRIKPQLHSQLLAEINIATQAKNSGLWDLDRALDFLGEQDKERIKNGMKRDKVEFSPEAIALETQLYVKTLQEALAPSEPGASPLGTPPGIPQPVAQPGEPLPGVPSNGSTPTNQPMVQGVVNQLRAAVQGQGANPNPTDAVRLRAQELAALARGGAPVGQPTTQP